MKEKVVSYSVGTQLGANVKQVIEIPEKGVVAEIMTYMGVELTFFHIGWMADPAVKQRFWYDCEAAQDYNDQVPEEVLKSIEANDGFFVPRHHLCKLAGSDVYSFGGGNHVTGMSVQEAKLLLENYGLPGIKGSLIHACIYDTLGQWLIETGCMTQEEWVNSPRDIFSQNDIMHRDHGGWCLDDLMCDLFSMELTQEHYGEDRVVTRGGTPFDTGEYVHPARARYTYAHGFKHPEAKIRAFFWLQ